jgi:hypothetical protein
MNQPTLLLPCLVATSLLTTAQVDEIAEIRVVPGSVVSVITNGSALPILNAGFAAANAAQFAYELPPRSAFSVTAQLELAVLTVPLDPQPAASRNA